MTRNHLLRYLAFFPALCVLLFVSMSSASAQTATVQEILSQKAQWKALADEGQKIVLDARFQGRAADAFRVKKLDIDFRLPGRIRLPDRMRDSQRLTITGKLVSNNGKIHFQVSALVVLDTDLEHLARQVAAIPENEPEQLLSLANSFTPTAEFYGDRDLAAEIRALRDLVIERRRKLAEGDPEKLREIYDAAVAMEIDPRRIDAIRFERFVRQWKFSPQGAVGLIPDLRMLPGWDASVADIPAPIKAVFPATATEFYNNATDNERRILHRLFYMMLRQEQIKQQLKPDGSNGLALANLIRTEFPEETSGAAFYEEREIEYRLGRVPDLSRQELMQLIELLNRLARKDSTSNVVAQWLKAQEQRFGTVELAGILRIADEHLFVAEQWKDAAHEARGIELLKQAWTVAATESPDDARLIAERLTRLGWERLNDQWMTTHQVQMLPKDDIQLAIREGRVVRGMTVAQVTKTLGQPSRISRLGSSRTMRELWIYDGDGAAGLVVRFRRSVVTKSDENTVEDVSRIPSGR